MMVESAGAAGAGPVPALLELIGASWASQAVYVAADLGIADHLASGARGIEDLAHAAGCERASLHRLMRGLAALGLCAETHDGRYEITALGALLRASSPRSLRSWALWWGCYQWAAWGGLGYSVRTGESARNLLTGHEGYGHLESNPQAAAVFDRAMTELTRIVAAEVLRVCEFSGIGRVVDVGGGHGELLCVVLSAHPEMRGVLFDLPRTARGAAARLAAAGVARRCEVVCGDFFQVVPGGGDVYVLKSVLHNWDDDRCAVILANCRTAMAAGARLWLIERVMPARMTGSATDRAMARTDLNMLVGPAGRERRESEFVALLAAAGFRVEKLIPTSLEVSVIEGVLA